MIFGNLNALGDTLPWLPAPLKRAVEHLAKTDLAALPAEKYALDGDDIFVIVSDMTTKPFAETRPEIHRNYIDIQVLVHGRERIGVAVDTGRNTVSEDTLAEKDLLFYTAAEGETMLEMTPGSFAVLFPSEAHRPGVAVEGPEPIRKIIVKVRAALCR